MDRPDLIADDPWWRFAVITVGGLFRATHRLRIEGLDRIPRVGPALLASNHVSPLDPIAIALGAVRKGRTIRYLAQVEAFDIPVVGWGLRRFRQIPIRRGAGDRAALEDAAGVIARGALAGIFPEGKLGTGEALLPARRGMARIALASGAPILPIGVWGMQVRWPVGGIKLRGPLRPVAAVVVGNPIPASGSVESDADVRALTDRTMATISELVTRARQLTRYRPSQSEASASESSG